MRLALLAFFIAVNALNLPRSHMKIVRQLDLFDDLNDESVLESPSYLSASATQTRFVSYSYSSSASTRSLLQSVTATPTASSVQSIGSTPTPSSLERTSPTVDPNATPTLLVETEKSGGTSLASQQKYAIIGSIIGAIVLVALIRALCAFKFGKRKDKETEVDRFSGVFNRRIMTQRASMFGHHV